MRMEQRDSHSTRERRRVEVPYIKNTVEYAGREGKKRIWERLTGIADEEEHLIFVSYPGVATRILPITG